MRAAEVKVLLEIFTASIFAHERFAADAAAMSIAAKNPGRRKSSRARAVRSAPRLARKQLLHRGSFRSKGRGAIAVEQNRGARNHADARA